MDMRVLQSQNLGGVSAKHRRKGSEFTGGDY